MKIAEQLYRNLNRPYYRGLPYDKLDYSKLRYNSIYFTNSFAYAAMYSYKGNNKHGHVYEYRLREGVNIFNANAKSDVMRLRLEIFKALKDKDSLFYKKFYDYSFDEEFFRQLGKHDWAYIIKNNDDDRECFVEIVKKAGFDGYFNFEWQKIARKTAKIEYGFEIENAPAIGMFNISKMKVVRKIEYKDFFKFKDFVEAYDEDADALSQYVSNLYNNGIDDYEEFAYKFAASSLLFLDKDAAADIIANPEELNESYKNTLSSRIFKECLECGRSNTTYNGFSCTLDKDYHLQWGRLID